MTLGRVVGRAALLAGLVLGPFALVVATSQPVAALTAITVSSNLDSGAGTLRAAITSANTTADDVEIDVTAGLSPITLASGLPGYSGGVGGTHSLTVKGNGVTVHGFAGADTFSISSTGSFTMDSVTISGGGNGIDSGSAVTVSNSTISGTSHDGIDTGNTVTVSNSTISGNTHDGIDTGGTVTVSNSTITGNTNDGIDTGNTVTVTNSTITGNTNGGIDTGSDVTLVYADVVHNGSPSGANVSTGDGSLTSFGSVVTGAGSGGDCSVGGTKTSNGWNFADDTTCGFTGTGDVQGTGHDPLLGTLASNGGPTETLLPQTGSPLIDAIPVASCQADGASGVTTDQRGITRPQGSGCDIGAVEVAVVTPTPAPVAAPAAVAMTPSFTG